MKEKVKANILILLDIFVVNVSLYTAYLLRFDFNYNNIPKEFLTNIQYVFIVSTGIKILCFIAFKLYSSLWRYAGVYELVSIVSASFISNAMVLSYIFVMQLMVPRSIFIIAFLLDIFLIGGTRFSYRVIRRIIKGEAIRFKNFKRILIIGDGDAGALIVKELRLHSELKSKPVAIISNESKKVNRKINGVPIVGTTNNILKIIEKYKIDEVIIAIPNANNKTITEIYNKCSSTHCKVKILPSFSQLIDETISIQKIRDVDIEDLLGREPVILDMEEISEYIREKVLLITGGGGSIGSELCRQIAVYSPKTILILDNYENSMFDIQNELIYRFPNLKIISIIANIRDRARIEWIFKKYKPEVVFHAAAHKHVPLMEENPGEAVKNNILGTLNVAECADKSGVKRFVLISTDKAVNPTNIMGATKRVAEMIIQALNRISNTEFVAVRFGNVLGSNGSVVPTFKRQIEQGGPVTVTHKDVTRFFMTIPEAVQLVLQAGAMAKGGEIFVLDMGEPVRIYDLAKNLIKLSGFEPDEDIVIEFTGLRPGEKLYEELLLDEEGLISTKNNKIFVAKPLFTDFALLKREIERLMRIGAEDSDKILEYMELIVPTYKKAQ